MALLRLAYVSASEIAGDLRERESIADILMSSRRTTRRPASPARCWPPATASRRVLEGEPETVEETCARITRDRGRVEIVLLLTEPVAERQFSTMVDGFYWTPPNRPKRRWRG